MRAALLTLLLFTSLAAGQPPAAEPTINFPAINTPTPPVNPTAPVQLDGSRLYVVSADVELLAWSFPEGLLRITADRGPLRIRAQFVDGNGLETREYKAKHVLIIEATGTGRVSLLVLPAGSTSKTAGVVKIIEAAALPRPPPGPDPKPEPKPEPKPVNEGPRFIVIVEESADGVATRAKVFTDTALSARMREKGHKFRIVDKDVIGADGKAPADVARFIDEAKTKGLPRVFFVDQKGLAIQSGPCPATPGELLDALRKAGG